MTEYTATVELTIEAESWSEAQRKAAEVSRRASSDGHYGSGLAGSEITSVERVDEEEGDGA